MAELIEKSDPVTLILNDLVNFAIDEPTYLDQYVHDECNVRICFFCQTVVYVTEDGTTTARPHGEDCLHIRTVSQSAIIREWLLTHTPKSSP